MRTSAGSDLYSSDKIVALMPTDLPEPVVPATSKCGILARSATIGLPAMSLPRATVRLDGLSLDLGADDFAQTHDLALGIGQLQRHIVFAREGLDHADGRQR